MWHTLIKYDYGYGYGHGYGDGNGTNKSPTPDCVITYLAWVQLVS